MASLEPVLLGNTKGGKILLQSLGLYLEFVQGESGENRLCLLVSGFAHSRRVTHATQVLCCSPKKPPPYCYMRLGGGDSTSRPHTWKLPRPWQGGLCPCWEPLRPPRCCGGTLGSLVSTADGDLLPAWRSPLLLLELGSRELTSSLGGAAGGRNLNFHISFSTSSFLCFTFSLHSLFVFWLKSIKSIQLLNPSSVQALCKH